MRDDTVQVLTEALRTHADDLADTAHHLGYGLHGIPGLTVTAPGWTAAEALLALESAVHGYLTSMGELATRAASGLRAAAAAYEAVDERVVQRLNRGR